MKTTVDQKPGRSLPRRDFVLLPLISLLTVILLVGAAEIGARLMWPEQKADSCLAVHGELGYRARPNCVSHTKAAEGPWVENHYNECGLLSPYSCRTPPPNALRLAAVGSSIGFTYLVPWQKSWQGLTAAKLGGLCGRTIDYQNFAGLYNMNEAAMRAPEAVAARPAAAVMFLDSTDLFQSPPLNFSLDEKAHADRITPPRTGWPTWSDIWYNLQIRQLKSDSRAAMVAEHYLFESGRSYLDLYLLNSDKADFMRAPLSAAWRGRLAVLDKDLGYVTDQFRTQNVPLLVIYVPQEAQAEVISGMKADTVDPYLINRAIAQIVQRHGATFIDASPQFAHTRNPLSYYYAVDGHLSEKGNALMADLVEQGLVGGAIPLLGGCQAPAGSPGGR